MNNIDKLIQLMKENPTLPVVACVDSEIVGDYGGRWLGSWGTAQIDKYIQGDEHTYFYDECDTENLLMETEGYTWYEHATEKECIERYRSLPWIECITVDINLPD